MQEQLVFVYQQMRVRAHTHTCTQGLEFFNTHTCLLAHREQVQAASQGYEGMAFHDAIDAIMLLCSKGNLYLDEVKPWSLFKSESGEERARAGLALCTVGVDVEMCPVHTSVSQG